MFFSLFSLLSFSMPTFVSRKFKGKGQKIELKNRRKENMKENKNQVKYNILFLFVTSNSFYLYQLINIKIK